MTAQLIGALPGSTRRRRSPHGEDAPRGRGHRLDGAVKEALETGRHRLVVATTMFALGFLVIAARLVDVSLIEPGEAPSPPQAAAPPTNQRADIVDRNGVVLATSLTTFSLYADPARVFDPREAARKLARVLPDLDERKVLAELTSKRRFVWLRRHLTPRQYESVNRLGIPGLSFRPEEGRIYPHGALFSHVIGFTDIDNEGISGIEKYLNAEPRRDGPLVLSLDVRVQHAVRRELLAAMKTYRAVGASGLVLDVRSGEILGMVSLPDFDPNRREGIPREALFNRNTLGVYEMGSTFKIFTVAAVLEDGVATLKDRYDATRPIRVARFVINDYKPHHKWLSVPEIFIYSSNIGAAKMALDLGGARQRRFLERLGLLRRPRIELPEVGEPMWPVPWRKINTMTVGYGHGLAVSPLQLASAVAAVVNDGIMVPPTLRKRGPGAVPEGRRVLSARTSRAVRSLMRQVVLRGTGRRADVPGYRVGGKTGTADKYRDRHGKRGLLSSFIAVFPVDAPRYLVLIILDDPKGTRATFNRATGGWVAAPTAARVITRIAPMLHVQPMLEDRFVRERLPVVQISSGSRDRAAR